jgi:hypothetical protein
MQRDPQGDTPIRPWSGKRRDKWKASPCSVLMGGAPGPIFISPQRYGSGLMNELGFNPFDGF